MARSIGFTNTPGATFTASATTSPSVAASNWTALGTITQASSGVCQFTDLQATNYAQRYYRVRSP